MSHFPKVKVKAIKVISCYLAIFQSRALFPSIVSRLLLYINPDFKSLSFPPLKLVNAPRLLSCFGLLLFPPFFYKFMFFFVFQSFACCCLNVIIFPLFFSYGPTLADSFACPTSSFTPPVLVSWLSSAETVDYPQFLLSDSFLLFFLLFYHHQHHHHHPHQQRSKTVNAKIVTLSSTLCRRNGFRRWRGRSRKEEEEEGERWEGKEGIWLISRDKRWEMDFIRQHSLKYE